MIKIYQEIQHLIEYGIMKGLLRRDDEIYVRNRILSVLSLQDWQEIQPDDSLNLSEILNRILNWSYENGVILSNTTTERDILDAEIMSCMIPRPSEVIREFEEKYSISPKKATDNFYQLAFSSNYVKSDQISKNIIWKTPTSYGKLDITINLAKPEKDPKEITLARNAPPSSYPKCLLCPTNEGYKGRISWPARGNHRIIPITLNNEEWFLQYSPYVYYNEHSIVFRKEHIPMKISSNTLKRLLDFTEKFPHYFIGSNADLPIVGGSILSHDHFQGGRYSFAMEKAELIHSFNLENVNVGILNWPLSVLRIKGEKEKTRQLAEFIINAWKDYSDLSVDILAYSGETPHNTVTPITRMRGQLYEIDIVLRNNRTSIEFPDGIFHPHPEHHHIKKENIGLIEVMGLAVLPGRLAMELKQISKHLLSPVKRENWDSDMRKHWDWYQELLQKYTNITEETVQEIIKKEVGLKFKRILEDAGVFKQTISGREAFYRFIKTVEKGISLEKTR